MSELSMTTEEREAFLADVHVGIISIAADGRAPLTVPVWYAYEPGGLVTVLTGPGSQKARLLERSRRFALCAQTESVPYKYVSVEGPVTSWEEGVDESERTAIAQRYLGDFAPMYLEATKDGVNITLRMRPERWLTVDYAKQFGDVTS
ncbi:MAG: pyridoxamine 5'-phosphate oxidase family protein [Acidimicrobiia bacterium]|nr:pyridoxamine 5'-phosphate oxidase family protein [Acidimicrobiia bacterium]